MKNVKFGVLFLGLALAVGSLSTQAASATPKRPSLKAAARPEPAQSRRPSVMVLEGRGAQLGVMISDVDPKDQEGVRIDEVDPDSPAEKAGLRAGDIVVEYDGERVRSARQLTRLVQETPDGRTVPIAVLRNGQKQTLQATPESRVASLDVGIDGDRLRDSIERGLREFSVEPPVFEFRHDDRGPRRFEYRLPERVMPFLGGRGRLGATVQSLTPELQEYFGASKGGVLVSGVSHESAAEKAGLKAGDVITSINGRPVEDQADLLRELRDLEGEVTLEILRDKKSMTLKATLEAGRRRGIASI